MSFAVVVVTETTEGLQEVSEGVRGTQVTPGVREPRTRMLENQHMERTGEERRGPGKVDVTVKGDGLESS